MEKHSWNRKSRIRQTMLKAKFYALVHATFLQEAKEIYNDALTNYFINGDLI